MMSPSPVAPHAPISLSAYAEDPAIGPSPTLQQRNFREVIPKVSMASSYSSFLMTKKKLTFSLKYCNLRG